LPAIILVIKNYLPVKLINSVILHVQRFQMNSYLYINHLEIGFSLCSKVVDVIVRIRCNDVDCFQLLLANFVLSIEKEKMKKGLSLFVIFIIYISGIIAQSNPDDYWLNNGFNNGDTVKTNSGYFYDDGGNDVYHENQDWTVRFCSENGNPITLDFSNFATHYGGPLPSGGEHALYDYMLVSYPPSADYVVYYNDTPEFSFTSQSTCINFGFHSDSDGDIDSGWVAEIYAVPAPFNNDPVDAEELIVGNVCSPGYYTNKGAYNSTGLESPPCKTYFGGDVWFKLIVPATGIVKIETFAGTLTYAILDIYSSTNSTIEDGERIACVDDEGVMPSVILSRPPGEILYIRVFGEQAKSGLFGICASDPSAPVTGFTGPGGVGDSVSIDFWFKPEIGILNTSGFAAGNNEEVETWTDQSGNGNHLVQSTSSLQPLYAQNLIRDYGGLSFNDDLFELESGSGDAPLHWFAAASFVGGARQTLLSIGDENINKTASISKHSDQRYFSFTTTDKYGPALTDSEYYIFHASHETNPQHHFLELNGLSMTVDAEVPLESDGSIQLGSSWDGADPFLGNVSELIQYRKSLNEAQKIIVNNYLAAKFDIALDSNDYYDWTSTYYYDVAGIGRVDVDNTHTKAESAGILAISGADDLEDYEFLLFGHDDGDFTTWSSANVPVGDTNIVRLDRKWRIDIEGTPGTVSMSMKKSALPALPADFVAYNIYIDDDGDFSSGAEAFGPFQIGSELVINNVTVNDGDYLAVAAVRPILSFTSNVSEELESVANPGIEFQLNYAISTAVEVDYSVSGGTAVQGTDYSLLASTITINPGLKTGEIVPLILEDTIPEIPDEFFDIEITSSTAGISIGTYSTNRHTILNNDLGVEASYITDSIIGECETSTLMAKALGTGPFTYAWSPAGSLDVADNDTVTANPASSTLYTVEVTDGFGQSRSDTIRVTVIPAPAAPVVTINGSASFCEGESVDLEANAGYAVYIWSDGGSGQTNNIVSNGTYSVVGEDAYGCRSDTSNKIDVIVHGIPLKPVISADGPLNFITGESVTLSAPASDAYLWSPDGELTQDIVVTTSGDYSVIVDNAFGCSSESSDVVTVVVSDFLPAPELTVTGPLQFCEGGEVTLTGPEGFTLYTWSNGNSGKEITITSSISITLIVTDGDGHTSLPSDEIAIQVDELPTLILVSTTEPLCNGDDNGEAQVSAAGGTSPYAYTWSTAGGSDNLLSNVTAGTYTVTVLDQNSCTNELELTIDEPDMITVDAAITPSYCPDFVDGAIDLMVEGGIFPYSVVWDDGSTDFYFDNLGPGPYNYTVYDANNCSVEGSVDVTYINEVCFEIPEVITPNGDSYNDYWLIEGMEVYTGVVIEVFDRWGKRVFYSEGHDDYFDGTFNGKELPMESYHYIIDLNNGSDRIVGNITIIR